MTWKDVDPIQFEAVVSKFGVLNPDTILDMKRVDTDPRCENEVWMFSKDEMAEGFLTVGLRTVSIYDYEWNPLWEDLVDYPIDMADLHTQAFYFWKAHEVLTPLLHQQGALACTTS